MDRRRFLGVNAVSAASLLAGSTASPTMRVPERRPDEMPADMDEYLARIDAGMSRIAAWSSAEQFPAWRGDRARVDALGRSALQSIFLTGMVGDLPTAGQVHPGVQRRLEAAMPVMDEAVESMTAYLRTRPASELAIVQAALRDHGAGPRIIGMMDEAATSIGLSEWRRAQTRSLFSSVEWRLRNLAPELVVSEYVGKVERMVAADVREEAASQELAARAAEAAFWAAEKSKRDRRISRGARTMGYGVIVFAGGAAIVAGGGAVGLFVGTVGVVMVLVGLIILLVGLSMPEEPTVPAPPDSTRAPA
jgi:hypothetical protein